MQTDAITTSGPETFQRFRHAVLYLDAQRLQDICQVRQFLKPLTIAHSKRCFLQACPRNTVMVFTAKQGCNTLQPGAVWPLLAVDYRA